MWHIFFIMWVSGSWKWTLINALKKSDIKNLHIPLSYKTRKIRKNEEEGVDSYFITKEKFVNWIEKWEFIEYWIPYDGNDYYGTKYIDVIDDGIEKSRNVIKEIEINWLKRLKNEKPDLEKDYTTIFLNIPSEMLETRIEKRWALMSDEEFDRRKISAETEIEESKKLCDHTIDATKWKEEVLKDTLGIINSIIRHQGN